MKKRNPLCTQIDKKFESPLRTYDVITDDDTYEVEATDYYLDDDKQKATFKISFNIGKEILVGEFFNVKAILLTDDITKELAPCMTLNSTKALQLE